MCIVCLHNVQKRTKIKYLKGYLFLFWLINFVVAVCRYAVPDTDAMDGSYVYSVVWPVCDVVDREGKDIILEPGGLRVFHPPSWSLVVGVVGSGRGEEELAE